MTRQVGRSSCIPPSDLDNLPERYLDVVIPELRSVCDDGVLLARAVSLAPLVHNVGRLTAMQYVGVVAASVIRVCVNRWCTCITGHPDTAR